ncbi:hypothetical protein AVEN_166671-1 [Araneus ventricosus]|nr:hypothetical protein AVEN_166671-1 [Araneus ventricosus]
MKQKVSNNTSNKEKDKNKIKENGKINVKEVQKKLDEDVVIMSCNSSNNLHLPIIDLKFSDNCFAALLDTGANVSLIQPSALEKIKEQNKVTFVSRSVRIHTLNNNTLPYHSAVNIKFRIGNKWFSNLFFVTQTNWSSKYSIILGYDFIQKNCIVLDISNQKILIEKQSFGFYEDTSRNSSPSLSADTESSQVRLVNNVTILPNSSRILKLKISDSFTNEKDVVYIPSCNADISINESIHNVDNSGNIITIAENNTSNKITLRKNSKLGQVHSTTDFIFRDSNDFDEEPNEILQVNTLTADEITTLRREELNADDFNLEHLNETEKNEILKLLMQNFKVFSKSYQTLGYTDVITPEFKLLHNFPIQTKPYPIPKIAHDFAKQEIQKLLEAGIIEPSTSNYSFPIIFVKKKSD